MTAPIESEVTRCAGCFADITHAGQWWLTVKGDDLSLSRDGNGATLPFCTDCKQSKIIRGEPLPTGETLPDGNE